MDLTLPLDKLTVGSTGGDGSTKARIKDKTYVVLVSTGSFNPPTYMHLRIFELARDALSLEGFCMIGGYMSPVNDAYEKRGLIAANHRIEMCNRACRSSEFIMVDPWEANQCTYQRTLTVLSRIRSSLSESGLISKESLKVMLVCGSDLLISFGIPGAWNCEQVRTICRDYGVVCIRREGQDVQKIISHDHILTEFKSNIRVVDELVPNQISSTRVREEEEEEEEEEESMSSQTYRRDCYCGKMTPLRTSWTDTNPGRRFKKCAKKKRCGFFQWHDPEMCYRSTKLIPRASQEH